MALIFPTGTLTNGQTFTNAGVTYTWDGTKWNAGISNISGTATGISGILPVVNGGTGLSTSNPKLIGSFTVAANDTNWWCVAAMDGSNQPRYAKFLLVTGNHLNIEITFSNGAGGDNGHVEVVVRGHYAYWTTYPSFIRYNPTGTNLPSYVEIQLPLTGGTGNTFTVYELENFSLSNLWVTYPMATTGVATAAGTSLQFFSNTAILRRDGYIGNGYTKEMNLSVGTGGLTALSTNVGTSGSFVTNGGALGIPSSGTVTNLTGTASININGTVGATTPTTGNFSLAQVGVGSGAVSLSTNDGYGDANVCFNHYNGTPDNTGVGAGLGSSARITSSVDSSTGSLSFQVGNSTSSGTAVGLTAVATMYTTGITCNVNLTAPVLISNVATGTAPFTVTSTTPVANLSIGGNAATATNSTNATFLRQTDGAGILTPVQSITTTGSRSTDLAPNTYSYGLFSEFKNSTTFSSTGNYSGLITYANYNGTTASTGDPSYQLLFSPTAANSTAAPVLKIRAGIDTTWGSWSTILHSSNYNSYSPTLTGTGASGTWGININGTVGAITPSTGTFTTISSGAFSGIVKLTGGSLQEVKSDLGTGVNIDISLGNYFTKTIAAVTTFTVSNVPTSGTVASFILDLTNGGAFTVTWWTGMKWAYGTVPTLTASGRDILGFFTYDAGTTWNGLVLAKDIK